MDKNEKKKWDNRDFPLHESTPHSFLPHTNFPTVSKSVLWPLRYKNHEYFHQIKKTFYLLISEKTYWENKVMHDMTCIYLALYDIG